MVAALRLLVVEGNTADARAQQAAISGSMASESYAGVLRSLVPDAAIDICFPADGTGIPGARGLSDYDGVAITGSALNLWKAEPASLRQVELAREVFGARVPFFGSCWGLQVACVAAGGEVRLNPKGREIGFARKITLTDDGRAHALHRGRPLAFDAPTVHSDVVALLPPDITVTAGNAMAEVQGAEIRHQGGVFWGVQYHPEYSLFDVAMTLRRYGSRLIDDGLFASESDLEQHVGELLALDRDCARKGGAWRLGIDQDVLDARARLTELSNWINGCVRLEQSRRGRA
jgi:GMP synthase (glutamine-hydrolysing)